MPLRVEIEQQETLERNQIKGGLDKLRKDTLHLEKKEYASATVYGSASITNLLPTFIEYQHPLRLTELIASLLPNFFDFFQSSHALFWSLEELDN